MAWLVEPLGNQPLKLTSHKQIDNEAAQRKTEESSERHSGALLGGYREVSACLCALMSEGGIGGWGGGEGGVCIGGRFGDCTTRSNITPCTLLLTIPDHVIASGSVCADCCIVPASRLVLEKRNVQSETTPKSQLCQWAQQEFLLPEAAQNQDLYCGSSLPRHSHLGECLGAVKQLSKTKEFPQKHLKTQILLSDAGFHHRLRGHPSCQLCCTAAVVAVQFPLTF